jgi:hypothetical protein
MAYIRGEAREQATMFPVTLDESIPADQMCRVPAQRGSDGAAGTLQPDNKSIAESRRMHSQAVAEAGAELVRFARSVGWVRGETIAIGGSKFRAVSNAKSGS